eukprot:13311150-Heterocapsa_arctica.AAC.1
MNKRLDSVEAKVSTDLVGAIKVNKFGRPAASSASASSTSRPSTVEGMTLTSGAWAKGTSSELIVKTIADLIVNIPEIQRQLDSIFTFQKRCRVGHVRFITQEGMWNALKHIKEYSEINVLTTNDGSPLWANPYKTAEQRKHEVPFVAPLPPSRTT